jgi:hypothetical protein
MLQRPERAPNRDICTLRAPATPRQKSGLGRYKEMPDRFLYEKLGLAYIRRGHVSYVTP